MTDPTEEKVRELRVLGHDVRPGYVINGDSVLGLRLDTGRLRITRRAEGAWEVASIGVPGLDLFVRLEGMSEEGVRQVIDRVAVPLARAHLQGQAGEGGRTPQSEPLSCPEGDGAGGSGGEGAQVSAPRWAYWVPVVGLWGGVGGFIAFAGWSEPAGPISSGWALAGGLGSLGVAVGTFAWGVWYAGRLRRRRGAAG